MKLFPKGKTVDTTNLRPVELINKNFVLYNVTYIRGFTSMITVVCAHNIIMWLFCLAFKQVHVLIIRFILTTIKN